MVVGDSDIVAGAGGEIDRLEDFEVVFGGDLVGDREVRVGLEEPCAGQVGDVGVGGCQDD